jgi:hypothetical protein
MTRTISIGGIVTGVVVALLAFHVLPARAAADQYQVSSVRVPFADLNPTAPEDA